MRSAPDNVAEAQVLLTLVAHPAKMRMQLLRCTESGFGTLRHFAATQDLVAIGAERTSIRLPQSSSVYECAPRHAVPRLN